MFASRRDYLDFAAAAPVSAAARRAFLRALPAYGNPSSPHALGRAAREILEIARETLARTLVVKADDVIFTSGATEANNLAIVGHIAALRARGRSGSIHALYAPTAHASVIRAVAALAGVATEPLPILPEGTVDTKALFALARPETALVAMDVVCGETGIVWNTREVRRVLNAAQAAHGTRIELFADAAQAPLVENIERTHIGADLLTLDAQKIGGVRGAGALVAHRTIPLAPVTFGGGQERDTRSGTPSPALAAAFAVALSASAKNRPAFVARAGAMRARLLATLRNSLPDLVVNEGRTQAPHILNLSFLGRDTEYLCALLDEAGFSVATTSACETDSALGSRAVLALYGDRARASSTLRVSWGPGVRATALMRFARALTRSLAFIDNPPR